MDSAHAYASDHVPLVTLEGTGPQGIAQDGIALKGGVGVTGRIVVAGDPAARVAVSLVWGPGAADRQTIQLAPLTGRWTTQRLQFASRPTSADSARLEIAGTGRGTFRVGAVSLMPADNVQGFRREVVAALATLHSGVYRFPGGNFVSGPYDWRDAIGDSRPACAALGPRVERAAAERLRPRRVHDALRAARRRAVRHRECRLRRRVLGGAAGGVRERRRDDADGTAARGQRTPEALRHQVLGDRQRDVGRLAVRLHGARPVDREAGAVRARHAQSRSLHRARRSWRDAGRDDRLGMAKKLTGQAVAEPMGKADWSAALLSRSIDDFEILSQHFYVYGPTHYDLEQGKQVPDDSSLSFVEWSRKPANMVRVAYEHFETYRERIPAMRRKPITVALDEWAYTGSPPGAFKPVPAYAWALDELFRHSDVFSMGGFTFAGSTLSASRTDAVLNPIGLMFQLYHDHFGTIPLRVSGTSPQPERTGRSGRRDPQRECRQRDLSTRRRRRALRRRYDADGVRRQSIRSPADAAARARGGTVAVGGTVWRMAPGSVTAANLVGREPQVRVERAAASATEPLVIPAISVGVYVFPASRKRPDGVVNRFHAHRSASRRGRLPEQPPVLAAELRRARVPHLVGDRLRARRSRQQQAASLLQSQVLLVLDRAHPRDRLEVTVQCRGAHVHMLRERLDLQRLREVLLDPAIAPATRAAVRIRSPSRPDGRAARPGAAGSATRAG
jgi:alpha-N-arabinofuranosidase